MEELDDVKEVLRVIGLPLAIVVRGGPKFAPGVTTITLAGDLSAAWLILIGVVDATATTDTQRRSALLIVLDVSVCAFTSVLQYVQIFVPRGVD